VRGSLIPPHSSEMLEKIENTKKAICKIFEKNGLKITIEANKKVVNFLDVTLDLQKELFKPYNKPGNVPIYINEKSNHPPAIKKSVPEGINTRLSRISSNEKVFNEETKIYQEALNRSGFKYKLKYKPEKKPDRKQNRKRSRNITWFNPPYDASVKTNVGKIFIKIIDTCFHKDHPLRKIFNRNTVKVSYSCMPNIKAKIDAHNHRQLRNIIKESTNCNCHNKNDCPLNGKCREKNIVYQATVQPIDSNGTNIDTYIGLTENEFKVRYRNHKQSFNNKALKNATELSKHVWKLKDRGISYIINWKIIGKAKPYSNISKKCYLCLLEKYHIICNKENATLNQRTELIGHCRHYSKYLLKNA
jgi:hypothetical protein